MIRTQPVTGIFRKSTLALVAGVMAIGLLASAPRSLAATMTWTNGNDVWTSPTAWTTNQSTGIDPVGLTNVTCIAGTVSNVTATCTGGTGGFPSSGDNARFTNDTSYTVTLSADLANLRTLTFSNIAGVVTMDAGSSTLTVTNQVSIGGYFGTSTVVWAGGTLAATFNNGGSPGASLQIGTQTNSSGTLIITNGTVIAEGNISLGQPIGSVGKLIVSRAGVFTNSTVPPVAGQVLRTRSAGSEITITNGGKFFYNNEVRCQSNSLIKVSDPNSLLFTTTPGAGSALTCGDLPGPGNMLIISNGAKVVVNNGTVSIGRNNGSSNTGIVVGAGSQLIVSTNVGTAAGITIGVGSAVHNGNDLRVYDGGYVFCDGAFLNISGTGTNCSFHMGGTGAMSTGVAVAVRMNSQSINASMVVSNALFNCAKMSVAGSLSNSLTVLAKGTLNVNAPAVTETNALGVSAVSGILTINAGTINAVSGTNGIAVTVGGSGTLTGNSLIITNGGNLFADAVRIQTNNAIRFTSGTLSVGGMRFDAGANNGLEFVVGDGTSPAYYDMTANGTGYHSFSSLGSPDLVVTNGAYLRGSGTLMGTIRLFGTFVPGFAGTIGTVVTSNSLTLGNSTVMNFDLGISGGNPTGDTVKVVGNLLLAGTLNITDAGSFGTGDYTLFTYVASLNTNSTLPAIGSTPNPSLTYTIDTNTVGSVILHVTGGGDPYSSWATTYGLSGGSALGTADPDGDGMSNTNEFLAGFNPTNSSARLKIISILKTDGTNNTITYLGASGDTSGSPGPKTNVLESTLGTPAPNYATNNFVSTGQTNVLSGGTGLGQTASFVDTNGASGPARYYRVRVLLP